MSRLWLALILALLPFAASASETQPTSTGGIVTGSQFVVSGSSPTPSAGAAAGASPTISVSAGSTNIAGVLNLTTGTSTTASGTLVTITFRGTLTVAPLGCDFTPRNAVSALAAAMLYSTAPTTASWTMAVGGTALTASTAYSWYYACE